MGSVRSVNLEIIVVNLECLEYWCGDAHSVGSGEKWINWCYTVHHTKLSSIKCFRVHCDFQSDLQFLQSIVSFAHATNCVINIRVIF